MKGKTPNAKLKALVTRDLADSEDDISEVLIKLNDLIPEINKSEDSTEKTMTFIRRIIKTKYGADSEEYKKSLTLMKLKNKDAKIAESKQRLLKKNQNTKQISLSGIQDMVEKLKDPKYLADGIILAMLATGGRLIEVLKVSNYAKSDKENYIKITDVAKQKKQKVVEKPVLFISPDELLTLIGDIRNTIADDLDKTNEELTNKYNGMVNTAIKTLFSDVNSSHDLRKIYGHQSYKLKPADDKSSLSAWLNKVLVHDSLDTSLNYTNIELV